MAPPDEPDKPEKYESVIVTHKPGLSIRSLSFVRTSSQDDLVGEGDFDCVRVGVCDSVGVGECDRVAVGVDVGQSSVLKYINTNEAAPESTVFPLIDVQIDELGK
jgi:hypothetical protein